MIEIIEVQKIDYEDSEQYFGKIVFDIEQQYYIYFREGLSSQNYKIPIELVNKIKRGLSIRNMGVASELVELKTTNFIIYNGDRFDLNKVIHYFTDKYTARDNNQTVFTIDLVFSNKSRTLLEFDTENKRNLYLKKLDKIFLPKEI